MFGFNRRFGNIQGIRALFVRRNPILQPLCAAVGFSDVEGSGIVGFNTPKAFRNGNTLFGPMFVKIGTQSVESQGSFNACDLVPVAVDDVAGGRTGYVPNGQDITKAISFQKLTATGGLDGDILLWLDYTQPGFGPIPETTYHGWYNGNYIQTTELMLEAGKSVWLKMPGEACCTFTVAGEVVKGDIYFPLAQGNTAVCNPQAAAVTTDVANGGIYPFAADPADIPNGQDITKAISFQKLTATGGSDGDILLWLDYTQPGFGPIPETTYYGWYTGNYVPVTNCSIAPGEGLWVKNPSNNKCSLCFPSVLAQ